MMPRGDATTGWPRWTRVLAISISTLVALLGVATSSAQLSANWNSSGNGRSNVRWQQNETTVGRASVGALVPRWTYTTSGPVSATPSVYAGSVYVPDWGGWLKKFDAQTGALTWSADIAAYSGFAGSSARTSPAVFSDTLILGTLNPTFEVTSFGAQVLSVQQTDGALRWITKVDDHPLSRISISPVISGNVVYVGVSSSEEEAEANNPVYTCCTFRGSIVALNATTGKILWKTMTVPAGYTGGAVWSGQPSVDPVRGLVYVSTGNNYTVPPAVAQCILNNPSSSSCTAQNDYFDSVLALNASTGAVVWSKRFLASDIFTDSPCSGPCPMADLDFGSGPNLFSAVIGGQSRALVGVGQKTGAYFALDAVTGALVWWTNVGPASPNGGIMWGTATDGKLIYVGDANGGHRPYKLKPSGLIVTGGAWTALDPATGAIVWQTGDPLNETHLGPPSVANGVVYVTSKDVGGHVYALNSSTGAILWSYVTGTPITGGVSVANGYVYVGNGLHDVGHVDPTGQFLAFGLPG